MQGMGLQWIGKHKKFTDLSCYIISLEEQFPCVQAEYKIKLQISVALTMKYGVFRKYLLRELQDLFSLSEYWMYKFIYMFILSLLWKWSQK